MATNFDNFEPPAPASTTTTSSTSTTTACTATIVSNAMTGLVAYKGVARGVPGFSYYTTTPANKNKIRVSGYRIKDLPSAGDGILYLNNVAVTDEQLISATDNGKLVYVPATDADAAATFNFLTETSCGNSANAAVSFVVSERPDDDCSCNTTTSSTTTTTT